MIFAEQRNISHRIEQFNFGPRVTGLVSPLAGAEQISESGQSRDMVAMPLGMISYINVPSCSVAT